MSPKSAIHTNLKRTCFERDIIIYKTMEPKSPSVWFESSITEIIFKVNILKARKVIKTK